MRTVLYRVLAIGIGLALSLTLAEMVIRAIGFSTNMVFLPNPYYGWSHTAGDHFTKTNIKGRTVEININANGLRDNEYSYEKPKDIFRAIVLGDSYAEAFQVPLESSFSKQIERHLSDLRRTGRSKLNVEIINTGVSGYGTDNEFLFFIHEGYKYSPDLVILAFYIGNDVRNNWRDLEIIDAGRDRKPYYSLGPAGLELRAYPFKQHDSLATKTKIFLNRHFSLYSFLRQTREQLRHEEFARDAIQQSQPPLDINLFAASPPEIWDKAWEITEALIVQLKQETVARGAQLFVILIPTEFQVHPASWWTGGKQIDVQWWL